MKLTVVRPSRYTDYRRNTFTPYPGVENRRTFLAKLVDAALAAVIAVSIVAVLLFLLALR